MKNKNKKNKSKSYHVDITKRRRKKEGFAYTQKKKKGKKNGKMSFCHFFIFRLQNHWRIFKFLYFQKRKKKKGL